MDLYTTEHEQVEALKRWWEKNGRSVLLGFLFAIVLVVGWQYWVAQRNAEAESASAEYRALLAEIDGRSDEVPNRARSIIANYPDTPYAGLASLVLAERSITQGEAEAGSAHLRWVMENGDTLGLKRLASLRLARILLDQGNPDEALAAVKDLAVGEGNGSVEEVRGDIFLAKGDIEAARKAYENALLGYADVPAKQPVVRMKLDDLAPAEVASK